MTKLSTGCTYATIPYDGKELINMDENVSIKEFALRHGNNHQAKVVALLKDYGWHFLVSPYYRDIATDKAREMDVIAEKELLISNGFRQGFVRFRLIIECKHIANDTVIWFDKKNSEGTINRILSDTPFRHPKGNTNIDAHHWRIKRDAAKLFASKTNGQERESENEVLFSAFDKVLNSLIYYRNTPTIIPEEELQPPLLFPRGIPYPVVVVDSFDKFYKTPIGSPDVVESMAEETIFQAEINYAYPSFINGRRSNQTEYFLIDVVPIGRFTDYLNYLGGTELNAIARMV